MRWRDLRRSDNVEDRRGRRVGRPVVVGGLGTLVVLVIAMLFGADPSQLLQILEGQAPLETSVEPSAGPAPGAPPDAFDDGREFVSAVLASTEDAWGAAFAARGARYEPPRLVLFTDAVESACGLSSAASGPFYCPADGQVYIDLGFFAELSERFGAPGDFAQAYVVAHEVGHHVQNLLGIAEQVHAARARLDAAEANALSVKLELQADCLAGVWGHRAQVRDRILEAGDLEEGLGAAAAIGDDRMQRMSTGTAHPESWTHGSSRQRVEWLRRGLQSGDLQACDTFQQLDR